jgi:hypothetical protein
MRTASQPEQISHAILPLRTQSTEHEPPSSFVPHDFSSLLPPHQEFSSLLCLLNLRSSNRDSSAIRIPRNLLKTQLVPNFNRYRNKESVSRPKGFPTPNTQDTTPYILSPAPDFSNRKPEILEPYLTPALSIKYHVLIANFEPNELRVNPPRNSNGIHGSQFADYALQTGMRIQTEATLSHSKQRVTLLFESYIQCLPLHPHQDSAIFTRGIHLVAVSVGDCAILPFGPAVTFWYSNCTYLGVKAVRANSSGVGESSGLSASLMHKHLTINPTIGKKAKGLEGSVSQATQHSPWDQI